MNRRKHRQIYPPSFKHVWVTFWLIVLVVCGLLWVATAEAQGTWVVTPTGPSTAVVVDPYGTHHTIITSPSHGFGYGLGQQPGWNQYPNPVDSFLSNYLRAQQQMRLIRGQE